MRAKELYLLPTEQRNPKTMNLDMLSSQEIVKLINDEDAKVIEAVKENIPQIALAIDIIVGALQNNGRLFYAGAGTSGRLGVLDASECAPTFGVEPEMIQGLIAGGHKAILHAVENAEDNQEDAIETLKNVNFTNNDVLVGIAASGRTPWVVSAMSYAHSIGAKTIALSCNEKALLGHYADVSIVTAVGPEVVTGSTRMKSGSAHKMVLNMLSTGAMIKIGKVYSNLMVDVQIANEKLAKRALSIVMDATGCSEEEAKDTLSQAEGHCKTAILMLLKQIKHEEAVKLLEQHKGIIRHCI